MSVLDDVVPFRNDAREAIPPFGMVQCREVLAVAPDRRLIFAGTSPLMRGANSVRVSGETYPRVGAAEDLRVNGYLEVGPGKFGRARAFDCDYVAFDTADGVPEVGQVWGPGESFRLRKDASGFVVLQQPDSDAQTVLVQRLPARGEWVLALNSYTTSGGDPVDLEPGWGVFLQGPHVENSISTSGTIFTPSPGVESSLDLFRADPVLRVLRNPSTNFTSGIVMDHIPAGHIGRVLVQGVHWCEITGTRTSPNNWATVATSGMGPLQTDRNGFARILGQYYPPASDESATRLAVVLVGQFGSLPNANSVQWVRISGPPTAGTFDLTWELPHADGPFTISLSDVAFDISAADLEQAIIDGSSGKVVAEDFTFSGSMVNGYRIEALSGGTYATRFLKHPIIATEDLEGVFVIAHNHYEVVGFLAAGY